MRRKILVLEGTAPPWLAFLHVHGGRSFEAGLPSEWPHVSGVDSRLQFKDELLDLLSRVIIAN